MSTTRGSAVTSSATTRKASEPVEWVRGQEAARAARAAVAEQLTALLVGRGMTGDRAVLALRVRQLAEAEREGDPAVVRAAVMEVSAAAAAWCVSLDLGQRGPLAHVR